MKVIRFVFFFVITLALFIFLNNSWGTIPPLGKLLSPHHGYLQNAEANPLDLPESLQLAGLKAPVSIQFDQQYIPHIYAENDEDLHFAQGYVTAYHRLWQMDFYHRVVFGRISEVVGERALNFDRENRRIGLKDMTMDFHDILMKDPEMSAVTQSYTAGVNAFIESLSPGDYPIEFKLLDYAPEKWTTVKTCTAYGLLANTLSKGNADLENTNALSLFGEEMFNLLFPDAPSYERLVPIYPKGTQWDFDPVPATKPNYDPLTLTTNRTFEHTDRLYGSNNFAVSGSRTKNGHPLLANEPDLRLTNPSIWYATHLQSPSRNVMGVTVPGTIGIIIGFNDSIAWGMTNSPRDQVDWYAIEFKNESRNEYRYNDQWFKTEKNVEVFDIRDAEVFYDTLIYVHHGPVVYDRNFMGNGEQINFAMRWMAHRDNTTFKAIYELNKAQNIQDYHSALRAFSGPPQNVIFASAGGDIAMRSPGRFPVKWEGQGKFLLDGANPDHEWKELIPYAHQMVAVNPDQGFLSSANQHQVDSTYPYYVYDHHFEYYRNRRINDRLKVMSNISYLDMIELQNDNFNYIASEILPDMLNALDSAGFDQVEWEYYQLLSEWDYFSEADLKAPSLFEVWWEKLSDSVWDEFDTITISVDKPDNYTTVDLLRDSLPVPFLDIIRTPAVEDRADLFKLSFDAMIDSVTNWKHEHGESIDWYLFKNTRISHILGLAPFSQEKIRIGGDKNIVNAAGRNWGPSWRMVVELDPEGVQAWAVYPGSQSGNPGNPSFGHMVDAWANESYIPLSFSSSLTAEELYHQITLHP